jgi:DNA-binding IclR family transcriptional regulator
VAQSPALIDENLQERLLGILERSRRALYLSELANWTGLTSEKVEPNLKVLDEAGKVTQNGKRYALAKPVEEAVVSTTLDFTKFSEHELHVLAALYSATSQKTASQVCTVVCKKALRSEIGVEQNQAVQKSLMTLFS